MKPINGVRYFESCEALHVKSENISQYESDKKIEQAWILDALRNTYISENSSYLFCNDSEITSDPLQKISTERQAVVEELANKFSCFSMEERLLFFLRIPATNSLTGFDSKLNILNGRVEIRRTAAWIRSHLQIDCGSSIPKRDVYDKYIEYCQSSRMTPISIADFGKVMKNMYPSVRPRRLGTRGKSQYCYAGITSCQDVKRPDLYEENSSFADDAESIHLSTLCDTQYAANNLKPPEHLQDNYEPKNLSSSVNSRMIYDTQLDCKDNQFNFSDNCSAFVKRCKQRKAIICSRNKFKKPSFYNNRSQKDFQPIDPSSDCQVEEEMAQYFQTENAPMKFVRETTPSASAFQRSLSFTGGCNEQYLVQNRSQSSAAVFAPKWANDENISENRHSTSCVTENLPFRSDSREATEKLSQLKLRSLSSQNSRHSKDNPNEQLGFTPISPSPIPWRINSTPVQDSHLFLKPESINLPTESLIRPRSFSTETKLNLKRDFQHAFSKITMCCNDELGKDNNSVAEAFRSQSLPCFDQRNVPNDQFDQSNLLEENNEMITDSEITCDELGSIFDNSMSTNNICFDNEKFNENILPSQDGLITQLDGYLNELKPCQDIIEVNNTGSKVNIDRGFGMLPQNSLENMNSSQEIFKANFDQFY